MSDHSSSTTDGTKSSPGHPSSSHCAQGLQGLEISAKEDGKHRDLTLEDPSFRLCPGVEEMQLLSKESEGV